MPRKVDIVCKNIFKGQNADEIQQGLLSKWIAIINHLEGIKKQHDSDKVAR